LDINGSVDGRIGEALSDGIDVGGCRFIRRIEVLVYARDAIEPLMVCGILGIN
jgi:hypothetical protein